MEEISEKEFGALELFKQRITDLVMDEYEKYDICLMRWLRARDLNVDKAEDMLRNSLKWRKDQDIYNIFYWETPEQILKECRLKSSGYCHDGSLVSIVPFGHWDLKKVVDMKFKEEWVRYVDLIFAQAYAVMSYKSRPGSVVTQFAIILDFEGFAYRQIASKGVLDVIVESMKRFEANYPETLKTAFVINAPRIFSILFALVKPLMSARTLSKVNIFASNPLGWKPALLKEIPPDSLPSYLGGANTSCQDYVLTPDIQSLTLESPLETLKNSELKSYSVDKGDELRIDVKVSSKNKLCWNFNTETYDINFKLLFDEEEEIPQVKVDSHIHMQKGAVFAKKKGTYTFVFDNKNSKTGRDINFGYRNISFTNSR